MICIHLIYKDIHLTRLSLVMVDGGQLTPEFRGSIVVRIEVLMTHSDQRWSSYGP